VKAKNQFNNRYLAVMADIHANEAALDCVLDFYKQQGIQQGIVLGDIVGYGPDPLVCIEKIQESPFEVIKGNHDHAVAMANTERGFSAHARDVINWTIEQLEESHREWLKYLPSFSKQEGWLAVHGAPIDPTFLYGYVYVMTAEDNLNHLQEKGVSLCFHGHSHMPGVYARDKHNRDHHLTDEEIDLGKYKHMLICPGSVGQPRNGGVGAQCAVYDQQEKRFSFITLPYSVEPVVQRMKDNNLPDQLWQRLQTGK
ncbi:MAG: metallophosphoesterase, partial [Methyloprofundus sp.]|nr:metallophosphoesterase [Methyloprofundus sp.]